MKKVFIISAILMPIAASAKVCVQITPGWLKTAPWTGTGNSGGDNLGTTRSAYTQSWADGVPGTWMVTQTSTGRTVGGMAACSNKEQPVGCVSHDSPECSGINSPGITSVPTNNKNCWCRMAGPTVGRNWVFLSALNSGSHCAGSCAYNCSACVTNGNKDYCSRAALVKVQ